jgi:tRNA modification GTPase
VSALTGEGLEVLIALLTDRARTLLTGEGAVITRERHRRELETAVGALDKALSAAGPELVAEELRASLSALGRITGRVDLDDLLDVVFRDFCIGK